MSTTERALDVVTFGETMVLLLAEPNVPLAEATDFRRSVAGSETNVAIGLARLGYRTGWFGRLGNDAFGTAALRAIRGEGVDTSHVVLDDSAPTGVLIRDCHEQRPVEVAYYRAGSAGSRLAAGDVDADYLAGADILHLSGITPVLSTSAHEATMAAVAAAKAADVTICFDPNIRRRLADTDHARQVLTPLVEAADVILAGADEAQLLSGEDDIERAAGRLLDRGAELVVIKDGAAGAWATNGAQRWSQPAPQVRVLDPVGAGDAFAAGFLSGLIDEQPVPESLRRGALCGAAVVQATGDVDGLPRTLARGLTDVLR